MAHQLRCRQHRNAAVDQRFHVEVAESVRVDRRTNALSPGSSEDVTDLARSVIGNSQPILSDASQFEAPKLSPKWLRSALPSEINPFLHPQRLLGS